MQQICTTEQCYIIWLFNCILLINFDNKQAAISQYAQGRCWPNGSLMVLFHCMVRHSMVQYSSLLGGFPLGTVPGTFLDLKEHCGRNID